MTNAREALAARQNAHSRPAPARPTLNARKPTGVIPWPLILLEGGEKSGKSWSAATLSASEKVGQTYWIDLGEGAADEYGAIPGARYLVIEHDGTINSVGGQIAAIRSEAVRAADAGEPPVVLVIDSMTAEWDLMKGIADRRARERLARKGKAIPDDVEPVISMDLWNDVNAKHRKIMTMLMTFPGIVVMTARGKEVASLDANGRPIEGSKEYKVEGQKNLAYDASVWLRVSRDHPPMVVGCRSVHAGLQHGVDRPRPVPGLTLEKVIFDVLKCNPATAKTRDLVELSPAEQPDTRPVSAPPAPDSPRARMNGLFRQADITDRDQGLAYVAEAVGREVASTGDLTDAEVAVVTAKLESFIAQQDGPVAQPPKDVQ